LYGKNTVGNKKEENSLKKKIMRSLHSPLPKRKNDREQTKKSSCKEDILTENC